MVGHVEWVDFVRVRRYPARGELSHAAGAFVHASGGGVVAAAVLAELGADVDFFCALGRDQNGRAAARELEQRGVTVHAAWRAAPTRRVITLLEAGGERTIVTIGERLQPAGDDDDLDWARLAEADGVYVTAGDPAAGMRARSARVLVASPRAQETLEDPGLAIDALVFSAADHDERERAERMAGRTRLMVATEGADGGRWWGESEGRWPPVAPPGEPKDDYGCGDSFAAGFTLGLSQGLAPLQAAAIGAECGARALTIDGAP